MQKHLNQLRQDQSGQALKITRLALNKIIEAKQGRIDPAIAEMAYQAATA